MSEKKNKKGGFVYDKTTQTKIFLEAEDDNCSYHSKTHYMHGYEIFDLMQNSSFIESLILLYVGELPSKQHGKVFELLMIGLMNPGPRHPAVRAAMVAGVSKTNTEHLLPIGLSVLGGSANGAKEVESAMTFMKQNLHLSPEKVAEKLLENSQIDTSKGEYLLSPGFGACFGSVDPYCISLVNHLSKEITNTQDFPAFGWAKQFVNRLSSGGISWLKTGIVAAILIDLGISTRQSIGIFQLICAPGIFAQGVEQSHMPITSIPMLTDENHHFQLPEDIDQ